MAATTSDRHRVLDFDIIVKDGKDKNTKTFDSACNVQLKGAFSEVTMKEESIPN